MNDSESFQIDFAGRVRLLQAYEAYAADVGMQTELHQLADELRKQHEKQLNDPSLLCVCEDILEFHEEMEGVPDYPLSPDIWNLYQRHRLILNSSVMLHRMSRRRWTKQNGIAMMALLAYGSAIVLILMQDWSHWLLLPPTLGIAVLILFWETLMRRLGLLPVLADVGDCVPFENRAQLDEVRRCTPDFDKQPYPFTSRLEENEVNDTDGFLLRWIRRGWRGGMWVFAILLLVRIAAVYILISPLMLLGITLTPEKHKKVHLIWPAQ